MILAARLSGDDIRVMPRKPSILGHVGKLKIAFLRNREGHIEILPLFRIERLVIANAFENSMLQAVQQPMRILLALNRALVSHPEE